MADFLWTSICRRREEERKRKGNALKEDEKKRLGEDEAVKVRDCDITWELAEWMCLGAEVARFLLGSLSCLSPSLPLSLPLLPAWAPHALSPTAAAPIRAAKPVRVFANVSWRTAAPRGCSLLPAHSRPHFFYKSFHDTCQTANIRVDNYTYKYTSWRCWHGCCLFSNASPWKREKDEREPRLCSTWWCKLSHCSHCDAAVTEQSHILTAVLYCTRMHRMLPKGVPCRMIVRCNAEASQFCAHPRTALARGITVGWSWAGWAGRHLEWLTE